jgi:uncharacterized protein YbjQ (UPF0145 family)
MLANAEAAIPVVFILLGYGSPLFMLFATWLIGRWIQKRHVQSLERRESDVGKRIIITNERRLPEGVNATQGSMVSGSVVVGTDYFRRFLAAWRNIFGGRVGSVEPILMRARREAILRMLDKADMQGANFVVNVRLETAIVGTTQSGNNRNKFSMCEVLAYGTAVSTGFVSSPYGVDPTADLRS